MGRKFLLGLDNGGTVTKAALYGADGEEIAVSGTQVKPIMEKIGFVERDMGALWAANAKAIRDVLKKAAVDPRDIVGVAVTGHGCGAYFIDEHGRPPPPPPRLQRHHIDGYQGQGVCGALECRRHL